MRVLAAVFMTIGMVGGVAVLAQRPEFPPVAPPSDPGLPPAAPLPPQRGPADAAADPMQDVDAFVEQGRKKAEESIARLEKEAETLRARLEKVESALERWRTVAAALGPKPGLSAHRGFRRATTVPPVADLPPTDLESSPLVPGPVRAPLSVSPPPELSPAPPEREPELPTSVPEPAKSAKPPR